MKKRIIAFALLLAALLSLVSCKPKEENEEEIPEDPYPGSLKIDESYVIVRPDLTDTYTTKAATTLREALINAGVNVGISTDYVTRGETAPEKEILVGSCKREISYDHKQLKEGECYIGSEGKRVIIDAYDSRALFSFVRRISEEWVKTVKEDNVLLFNDEIANTLRTTVDNVAVIRVISQNLRCADDGNGNDVKDRKVRLKQMIEQYSPDLIGTQETTSTWNNIMSSYFGAEYGMVGCSRDGKDAKTGEWNTVLYKKSRFDLIDSDTFWLTDTPAVKSRVDGSLCNRICTWALLKDKITGKTVMMCNTHLDHGEESVRTKQAKCLMNYLKKYIGKYPIFLTGDFNTFSSTDAYRTIDEKFDDSKKGAIANTSSVGYTFHSYGSTQKEIDFCFFDANFAEALEYHVISDKYNGYVSDHYGLFADFILK